MTPDYRAALAELVEAVHADGGFSWFRNLYEVANRARTALAHPEPEGVADEEIAQCLIAAGVDAMEGESDGTNRMYWEGWHEQVIAGIRAVIAADRARAALAQPEPEGPSDEALIAAAKAAVDAYPRVSELPYFMDPDATEYEPLLLALRAAAAMGNTTTTPVTVNTLTQSALPKSP